MPESAKIFISFWSGIPQNGFSINVYLGSCFVFVRTLVKKKWEIFVNTLRLGFLGTFNLYRGQ